jgi:hypothetical protein
MLSSGPCRITLSRDAEDNVNVQIENNIVRKTPQTPGRKISLVSLFDLSW